MPRLTASNDPAAWVNDHYEAVLRLALHLTGHIPDAEDLTQQTFIRAAQAAGRFDPNKPLKPWLARILIREFLNWKRGARVSEALNEDHYACLDLSVDAIVLLDAISSLSDPLRITFLLVEVHQFSVQEAGAALRVPTGTVKFRLHSARKKLQALLATTYPHAIVHETL